MVVSATFQLVASPSVPRVNPSTWLPESPMKTSAGFPGRKLKMRKPRHVPMSARESTSRSRSSWTVSASIAKSVALISARVPARPSMLSSRLKAFVIPTSQRTPSAAARKSFETISTVSPQASATAAAPNWAAELEPRGQCVDVVDEARDEEDRGAAEDAEELLVGVDAADRDRCADPGGEPEVEADAPEGRGRMLAPALPARVRHEAVSER